jgi:hypothetical protein
MPYRVFSHASLKQAKMGGNATTDCIVNGRACGKNATAEKSWA